MSDHIVVGANFGDEGKGLVTDYLATKLDNNIVVRFNGGGQAAHTVELQDGRRHIFHHIGSGTLQGSPTLLSEHFIVNPRVFLDEYFMVPTDFPKVFVHREALLTIPYDWLMNQHVEVSRGNKKHGSCGMGINETVTRASKGFKTTVSDLYNHIELKKKLKRIRNQYVPNRAKELGIEIERFNFDPKEYIEDCRLMSRLITPVGNYSILKHFDNRIFEGAQGLALDEYHYYFPHVTRSRTGAINATDILKKIDVHDANVHYVTRTHLTRHGHGPLLFEGGVESKYDETNIHNDNQGTLRFANLDLRFMHESISNDLRNTNFKLNPSLMVTWGQHIDTIIDVHGYRYGEELDIALKEEFSNIPQTWFMDRYKESAEPK